MLFAEEAFWVMNYDKKRLSERDIVINNQMQHPYSNTFQTNVASLWI